MENTENFRPSLTPKQKKVLDFIDFFSQQRGFAPSQQEIASHFGFKSLGTVQNYLVRLERQGVLKKPWNAKRGMQAIQPKKAKAIPLPLAGTVAAGYPIEAIESHESIDVPAFMLADGGEHFVLRVSGESMIDEGILHGDYVIIRKQTSARNGETVVAMLENEATIKKFFKKEQAIELHPANPSFSPIVISAEQAQTFRILGTLAGVIRQYD